MTQPSTVRPASPLLQRRRCCPTATEDIKLAAAAENVSITAAKAIGLDAETTVTVDGKTGVTVTSAKAMLLSPQQRVMLL